jgi:hypothetical protein
MSSTTVLLQYGILAQIVSHSQFTVHRFLPTQQATEKIEKIYGQAIVRCAFHPHIKRKKCTPCNGWLSNAQEGSSGPKMVRLEFVAGPSIYYAAVLNLLLGHQFIMLLSALLISSGSLEDG